MRRCEAVRTGAAIVLALAACFFLLVKASAAKACVCEADDSQDEARSLEPGHTVEAKLAAHEQHVYELDLSEGQFLRFTVAAENRATNIRLTVSGPDGNKVEELSGPVCPFPLYFMPTVSGAYRLHLELSGGDGSPEAYRLQIDELREASDKDETRTAASRAMVEAFRASAQDSPTSKQHSAQKFEEAVVLFRNAEDRRGEAEVFQVLSFRSFVARDYERAVDYLRQAQPLWHALADYGREADALQKMANYLGRLGRSEEAFEALNEAVPLVQTLGDAWSEGMLLDALGDAYDERGEYQEALKTYERALSLFRVAGKPRIEYEYGALADLGQLYEDLGEPQEALEYYRQGLALAHSHNNRDLEMPMLCVMAKAYAGTGDEERALEYYNKAWGLARGNRDDEIWVLSKLGPFYVERGEFEEALRCLDQTLPYARAEHHPMLEATELSSLATIYDKQGKWHQALEALNQAVSVWPFKDGMRRRFLRQIGSVRLDSGDSVKALEFYEKSLTENRAAKDLPLEALALCDVARAERALHQTAEARRDVEAGLNVLESVRARIAGSESRASYFAMAQKNYQFYIDLLMQMHAEQPDQGLDAAALQVSERAHARSLLDMLVEAHANIHEGADPKLLERERKLQQRLRARSEYQVQLMTGQYTPQQAEGVARELQALTAEYDATEVQIRANSPRYASLTQPVPLDLKQIQDQVLDSDTVLLEYSLGEDRSYLWAVTVSNLASFTLPGRAEIERAARRVYDLLTARNAHPKGEPELQREARIARARTQYSAAATGLSEMVLGPAAALLEHKRLLIVSDGALQYIPFAALPVPGTGRTGGTPGQPLVVESEIVATPSASTAAALRRDLAGRQPAPKALAVLADPVFDSEDPRVSTSRRVSPARPAGARALHIGDFPTDLERSWTEVSSPERGWKVPRLPFSRREADAIIAAAPSGEGLEAVDFHASRATATSPELAEYRVVHFATHGMLDSRTPALSGVIHSLVDQQGKPQDGFLRLWDIYNLRLPADLVVLSACQTALGKEVKGEGLVGLTRGFMYAGAARVIASLWQVDDVATADLMAQFYRAYLKKNLPPAAAMRAAQIHMWKQKRWQEPYFWGAFQLQGEWK